MTPEYLREEQVHLRPGQPGRWSCMHRSKSGTVEVNMCILSEKPGRSPKCLPGVLGIVLVLLARARSVGVQREKVLGWSAWVPLSAGVRAPQIGPLSAIPLVNQDGNQRWIGGDFPGRDDAVRCHFDGHVFRRVFSHSWQDGQRHPG